MSAISRAVAPTGVRGPIEFVLAMTGRDMMAPAHGTDRLEEFFATLVGSH